MSFPRAGYYLAFDGVGSRTELGASDTYSRYAAQARIAFSTGRHTLRLTARGGGAPDEDELPIYAQFQLGGLLNMSGYRPQQLIGSHFIYGRALYQYKIGNISLFDGVYTGLAYELADMPQRIETNDRSLFQPDTFFLAADTPLSIGYLGFGFASGGNQAIYLFLGNPY